MQHAEAFLLSSCYSDLNRDMSNTCSSTSPVHSHPSRSAADQTRRAIWKDTGHWTQACRVPMAAVHGLMARQKKRALAPPISLASVLPPSRPLLFLASPFPRPSCLRPLPSCIPTSYPDPLSFPAFLSPLLRKPPGTSDLLRVLICYEWRCGFILLLLWFLYF